MYWQQLAQAILLKRRKKNSDLESRADKKANKDIGRVANASEVLSLCHLKTLFKGAA